MNSEKKPRGIHTTVKYFSQEESKTLYSNQRHDIW